MHPRIFPDGLLAIQRTCAARALLNHNQVVKEAARELGVHRRTLAVWMRRGGLKTLEACIAAAADMSLVPPGTRILRAYRIYERSRLEAALAEHKNNQTYAARALGISRRALATRLREYKLRRKDRP